MIIGIFLLMATTLVGPIRNKPAERHLAKMVTNQKRYREGSTSTTKRGVRGQFRAFDAAAPDANLPAVVLSMTANVNEELLIGCIHKKEYWNFRDKVKPYFKPFQSKTGEC
jgi:hypothetical protein